jgi:pimeloyl-ACP methyl ester carboxylesterase
MAEPETDRLSVDAGGQGLLAQFNGAVPSAPAWFERAIAQAPERVMVDVGAAKISALAWGARGKPGLLLLHGNGAHADWWSFIAPFFAQDFRVIAPTWSGMGDSTWREAYGIDLFVEEALAVSEALGLFDGPTKPLVAAHSFGGFPALGMAHRHGARFAGIVSIDSPVEPPGEEHDGPPSRSKANRFYPTLEAALLRFRLAPAQPCENLFAVDFIGRRSIKETPEGFTWKFDPFIWQKFSGDPPSMLLREAQCPMAVMWGDRSILMPERVVAYMRTLAGQGAPFIPIPEAAHHVMLDQPLAFVAALRGLFAGWPSHKA